LKGHTDKKIDKVNTLRMKIIFTILLISLAATTYRQYGLYNQCEDTWNLL